MFYNRDQEGLEALANTAVQINETITLDSTYADMEQYEVENSSHFYSISLKESLRIFSEKSSAILFYAKPTSKECKIAVKVLDEVAKELNVKVYIVDTSDSVSEEDITTLSEYISSTFHVDDAGNTSFVVPDLIAVNAGEITGFHTSTVKGISVSSDSIELTENQTKELKTEYLKVVHSISKSA